jgi:hypothetical protein
MKAIGAAVPVAWPHDGNIRGDRATGETMAKLYKAQGLNMLPVHATWPDGGFSTEAGVTEMQERMTTGKFKVAAICRSSLRNFACTTARTARSSRSATTSCRRRALP